MQTVVRRRADTDGNERTGGRIRQGDPSDGGGGRVRQVDEAAQCLADEERLEARRDLHAVAEEDPGGRRVPRSVLVPGAHLDEPLHELGQGGEGDRRALQPHDLDRDAVWLGRA